MASQRMKSKNRLHVGGDAVHQRARRSIMRGTLFISCAAVALVAAMGLDALAASRGRQGSPYVKTPWGLIPKSVYNQPFVRNPAGLEQYRQREQQALGQRQGGTQAKGRTSTTKK
jgi:hypothetical protein